MSISRTLSNFRTQTRLMLNFVVAPAYSKKFASTVSTTSRMEIYGITTKLGHIGCVPVTHVSVMKLLNLFVLTYK